jgi:hypothetical protein
VRVLIWGTVVVFGFAVCAVAISVHGSADERAAIKRAVRAPLHDLRRRDARGLCGDFTAAAQAHIVPGAGSCDSRLAHEFHMPRAAALYSSARQTAPAPRLRVTAISWHGDWATAVSSYSGERASEYHWRLRRVDGRWRVATPATLRLRADCTRPAPVARNCADALSMPFASGASGRRRTAPSPIHGASRAPTPTTPARLR